MQEDIDLIFDMTEESMNEALARLSRELLRVRTGKASSSMVDGLLVDYYGSPTAISQVANLSIADSRTVVIQPWEKSMIGPIEQAIFKANLGVTPQNDGQIVRIVIPPLTEDRRKSLVKQARALSEDAKISVRNARRDAIEGIKKAVKDGYSEDLGKRAEEKVQKLTNDFSLKADTLANSKEKDIMTV